MARQATRWMRVVSMRSATAIAGGMVVRRRASIDWPAPGGPKLGTLWTHASIGFHFTSSAPSRRAMWRSRSLIVLAEVVWQVRARWITGTSYEGANDVMR